MDLYHNILEEWESFDDLEPDRQSRRVVQSRAHVVNDYNLNSAILPDLHMEVLASLKSGMIGRNAQHVFRLRQLPNIQWDRTQSVHEFPKLLATLTSAPFNVDVFHHYFKWDVDQLFQRYKKVVDKFLEVKSVPSSLSRITMTEITTDPVVRKLKESFQTFNFITELINSASPDERIELSRRVNSKRFHLVEKSTIQNENVFVAKFDSAWGRIFIVSGWCYMVVQQQLLSRSMILMLKDTFVARYDSLCALHIMRHVKGDSRDATQRLKTLYALGDKVLMCLGNEAFNVLKMLEGACTARWMELAGHHRPYVVQDTNFRTYLNKEIQDFHLNEVNHFFDHVLGEDDVEIVGVFYSCFRHWGHPVVDCDAGLEKLHELVTRPILVDGDFANELGSNFAELMLREIYKRRTKWYVDIEKTSPTLREEHPLFFSCLQNNLAITTVAANAFGKKWHELELLPIFDVPDHVDPSVIYDDKGHSVTRSDFIKALRTKSSKTSERVLSKALKKEIPNVGEFLRRVDEFGLDDDHLIIGLKAKERELKIMARFFALMTWDLRLYFVLTEYLIKKDILPYFPELTMADSGLKTIEKMLDALKGHGCEDESQVTYTNGIDYKKWNNMQRKESSDPVFRVMGKLYGLPNLFTRTHEFFAKSWVYYSGATKDLTVNAAGVPQSPINKKYFWHGQEGGFEGLRQKGWTILSALILRRTLDMNVTKSVVLAQGDNQIISLQFKVDRGLSIQDRDSELLKIQAKNRFIMDVIFDDIVRLGLEINKEETITSTDVLIYGKKIFVRACRVPLYCKIFSRATCSSNDQLPSLPTLISSIVTMSLTSAQESDAASPAMYLYVYFAIFTATQLITHNVLARRSLMPEYKDNNSEFRIDLFWLNLLFLDPALGGAGGASLSRFIVRGYPDPVTESLSFYKIMASSGLPNDWGRIFTAFGHPYTAKRGTNFRKLLENPLSINIARPANAVNIVKDKIKAAILGSTESITNTVMKDLFNGYEPAESNLVQALSEIKPCFPRFNSEFLAATHVGVADSMMSLFQNARTLRMCFGASLGQDIHNQLVNVEINLMTPKMRFNMPLWKCSATHADSLREEWGVPIVGVTIPHPLEHLSISQYQVATCPYDVELSPFINVSVCSSIDKLHATPGPMTPYLGSSTSEGASNFNNWERSTVEPVVSKAGNMRRSVGWLFPPVSTLTDAIMDNLESLTGVSGWEKGLGIYYRSGNPFHRFNSSRQASGGFTSINPNYPQYLSISSDTLNVGTQNYDFMFQSCIIYAQYFSCEFLYHTNEHTGNHHYHRGCLSCERPLEECELTSKKRFYFPDKSATLKLMGYNSEKDVLRQSPLTVNEIKGLAKMDIDVFSKIVGFSLGHFLSISTFRRDDQMEAKDLCTFELRSRINPGPFLRHFFEGVFNGALYKCLTQFPYVMRDRLLCQVIDFYWVLLKQVVKQPPLLKMLDYDHMHTHLLTNNLSASCRYPDDLESLSESLLREARQDLAYTSLCRQRRLLIPSDWSVMKNQVIGFCVTRARTLLAANMRGLKETKRKEQWKLNKQILMCCLTDDEDINVKHISDVAGGYPNAIIVSRRDMRSLAKERRQYNPPQGPKLRWGNECDLGCVRLDASRLGFHRQQPPIIPDYYDSLIRGLRLPRFSTGAYLKLVSMLNGKEISPKLSLCLADGSGGFCSYILRKFPNTRCYFNSLRESTGGELGGRQAGAPSALQCLSEHDLNRCDNRLYCWQDAGDLNMQSTWDNIQTYLVRSSGALGLITVDINHDDQNSILKTLLSQQNFWCDQNVHLIYKLFAPSCLAVLNNPIDLLNAHFLSVEIAFPGAQSYGTKELYAICTKPRPTQLKTALTDITVLKEIAKHCRALNPNKEHERIEKLLSADQYAGVPIGIRPDPFELLLSVLGRFNVAPTIQNALKHLLKTLPESDVHLALDIVEAVCVCSFVPIHTCYKQSWEGLSDNDIIQVHSLQLAKQLYQSARSRDYKAIEQVARIRVQPMTFMHEVRDEPGVLTYRFSVGLKLKTIKHISRCRDIPLESFIIRAFHSAYQCGTYRKKVCTNYKILRNVNTKLRHFNYAWGFQHIFNHTGLLGDYCSRSKWCRNCPVKTYMLAKTSDEIYRT